MDTSNHTTKLCTKCRRELPATIEYFSVRSDNPTKFQSWCKYCKSVEFGHVPKEKYPDGFKRCNECKQLKPLNEFHKHKAAIDGYRYICKKCRAKDEGFVYKPPAKIGCRRCCTCKQEFPATDEYFFKKHKAGDLQSECKTCYQNRIREHRRNHPEWGVQSKHARRVLVKAAGGRVKASDVRLQLKSQKGLCWWCGKPAGNYHIDHVIPLARGGSNDARNIVISCAHCNQSKGAKLPSEWMGRLF